MATRCVEQWCEQPATTSRDRRPQCAACAADHDRFAELHPIGVLFISPVQTASNPQGAGPIRQDQSAPCHPARCNAHEVIPS